MLGRTPHVGYGAIARRPQPPGRFRLLLALLLLVGVALHNYGAYVLYVVAIRMVASDVLAAGLAELGGVGGPQGAAALEGSCPAPLASPQPAATNLTRAAELEAGVARQLAEGSLLEWSVAQRGLMFTGFTLGSLLAAIQHSRLALAYGPKLVVSASLLASTLHALLFPLLASRLPFWLTLAFQVAAGAASTGLASVAFPLAAAWLLPAEATAYVLLHQLAVLLGTTLAQFATSHLLAALHWSSCFYLTAVPLALVSLAWLALAADRPAHSRLISAAEREMLESGSLASTNRAADWLRLPDAAHCLCSGPAADKCPARQLRRTPHWRKLLACPTIWSLVLLNFAVCWNIKVATLWPTYFANILHLAPATIGNLILAKGLLTCLLALLFAYLSSRRRHQQPMSHSSLTRLRRLNQLLSTCLLGLSVALIAFLDCNRLASTASVLLTPFVDILNILSLFSLPLDLSPEDSGLITSYMTTLGMGDLIALPAVTQILAAGANPQLGSRRTWSIVWLLGLALKVVACLVFMAFARAEPKSYSHLCPAGPCNCLKRKPINN